MEFLSSSVDIRRERDIEQLRRVALAQELQIHALLRTLRAKCDELAALKGNEQELQQTLALIEQLSRSVPASSSSSEQDTQAATSGSPKTRAQSGPTDQPMLPIVEQTFELDAADMTCPSCGGQLRPMKDQFDTSEMIDVVEVSYRVVQVKQQKYVCKCGGCIETAPGPERATPGGRYSLDFAIKVALDKYLDHIPLARQERILRRHGLEITTQTLWDQLHALGRRLEKASRALLARVLAEPVVGLDQTSWKRLEVKDGKPWQMWCLTAPGLVARQIRDDKGAATFKELMAGYCGTIVCDALKTHEAGARGNDDIVLAGCWAHVFRKFEEAAPDHPEAKRALEWIGTLYEIDARAGDDVERRGELRRTESTAVLSALKDWLWSQAALKTLSIGNAAAYVVANWDRLTRFVQDARIPLDNNATERGIRGPVVGRKNHYGSRSRRGPRSPPFSTPCSRRPSSRVSTPPGTCARLHLPTRAGKYWARGRGSAALALRIGLRRRTDYRIGPVEKAKRREKPALSHDHPVAGDFRFGEDRHTGVFTCRHVWTDGKPILFVSRDEDGDWQFLCDDDHRAAVANESLLVCLEHIVSRDPSVNELATMCTAHVAKREGLGAPSRIEDGTPDHIRKVIDQHGHVGRFDHADGDAPAFAYTIGLYEKLVIRDHHLWTRA